MDLLLADLARFEERPPTPILSDIRACSLDVVRLGIESRITRDGRISVEAGHRVYEAARDMLLSAACSVREPRASFPRRKTAEAMDLIRRARFGQPEVGSFVLTIECEVPQRLLDDTTTEDIGHEPLERLACVRLAHALSGVGDASREAAAEATLEPFRRRIGQGVNANLCDAIAEVFDATEAETLRASFSFATQRPNLDPTPGSVVFSADVAGQLREAATGLREAATYVSFEVKGHVVRLDSTAAAVGGTAIVHTEVDTGWRHVAIALDGNDYQAAITAHRTGAVVRCMGTLHRAGRTWVVEDAREFGVIPER
ncbi:MAG: hypothetical protein IPK26_12345 [Planctomycetes bacterium]|nr:hypothetical protein [Planctomycetota bacterium]